jgi:UDP-N-acetylglucosamine 1-carboxyvinyltransferase
MDMVTVTGTENLMMAATLATVRDGDRERGPGTRGGRSGQLPQPPWGRRISGAGTDTIVIDGVDSLDGHRYDVLPDRIETGTFLVAGAITAGSVRCATRRPAPWTRCCQARGGGRA